MTKITKEELACRLNGRQYGDEITDEEERQAKEYGLLVVFGCSDDSVEFRGIFSDEVGAWNGTTVRVDSIGVLPSWNDVVSREEESFAEEYFKRKDQGKDIEALWADTAKVPPWTFKTKIPHATFTIMEDGEPFCIGLVISAEDLE